MKTKAIYANGDLVVLKNRFGGGVWKVLYRTFGAWYVVNGYIVAIVDEDGKVKTEKKIGPSAIQGLV